MNLRNTNFLGTEKELNLDDFLRMSDVASQIRQFQEEVGKQLDIDQAKAVLREKLLKSAKEKKEELTPEQVGTAIDNFYSDKYSFKEPFKNFETTFANLYIARKKIAVVAGTLTAITALSWATTTAISSAYKFSLERGVENVLEQGYRERQDLGEKLKEIVSSPLRKQLPQSEQNKLEASITTSEGRLKESDKILEKYCPKGSAKKAVTQKNFDEAKKQIPVLQSILTPIIPQIEDGRKIIETQKQFVSTKQSLDSLIGEIRNSKPLPLLLQKAEIAYSNGTTCVDNRQLSDAQNYQRQLTTFKQDIVSFLDLTGKVEKIYKNVIAVAKEDEAKTEGEKLYQEAKQFIQTTDVTRLRQAVSQLENLDGVLNQEYTLRIVSRPGVKSGIDRYYTDERGKRVAGYYLIVEGVDSKGKVLQKNIKNEENGRTETVAMWGERVPEWLYEKVKADKLDNGRIDNDVVGKKEKGYLNEKILMQGVEKSGQITRW